MDLRASTSDDGTAIRGLLQDSRLPVDDLGTTVIDFIVAVEDATLAGVVGIERFGDSGLLRSLAVRADRRGHGIGERLVRALEAQASAHGLRQLVLLTETAAPFFARRGYVEIARDQAPAAVRASTEFRTLCPASALCMIKPLESVP